VGFLTARAAGADRVAGLRAGADDYVVKPFSLEELLARVDAVLRRASPEPAAASGVLRVDDLELDEDSHEVRKAGQDVILTATEFKLLRLFMRNERVVLSKAVILERVWEYGFNGNSNIVEIYVGYLRKKVDTGERKLIHTVRGAGYVLKPAR
jgi:two-component system OmpR family response regulator